MDTISFSLFSKQLETIAPFHLHDTEDSTIYTSFVLILFKILLYT